MTSVSLTIGGARPVLGTFGKGLAGAVALNFGRSGGRHCATGCPYHPASTSPHAEPERARCYAATCERRPDRLALAAKLARHEDAGPAEVVAAAVVELDHRGWRLPWFRLSAFGSVPAKVPAGLAGLLARLAAVGTPVHLPVETGRKAAAYRRGLAGVPVVVRESVAGPRRWLSAGGPCSAVAGSMEQRPRERVEAAKAAARARTAAVGRRCIVCPAVAASALRTGSTRAKCGACIACADPAVDVVYPVHR